MTNSIRTPRLGKTASSRRIAEAVDDEAWQEFRVSLKGLSTQTKLWKLEEYIKSNCGAAHNTSLDVRVPDCDYCIRVDNYIKALCRGGQLYPGETLWTALKEQWNLLVKK